MLVQINTSCAVSSQHHYHLHPTLATPEPPHLVIQGSWHRHVSEGQIRGVISVTQRLRLSFHSSS